jgi:hypothetical protein
VSVVDKDSGFRKLVEGLGLLDRYAVDVGILQDKGGELTEDGDITLAGYASVNEFGSADGRVPERSFLRSTVDENAAKYGDLLTKAMGRATDRIVRGEAAPSIIYTELGRVGLRAVRDVKRKIRDLRDPPNSPVTIALKGSSNPLIDTGHMRKSISHRVRKEVR